MNILVLGLGNTLLRDDGLGVLAVEWLQEHYRLPAEVLALQGGAEGPALAPLLEGATHLLILSAVHSRRRPGSLVRLQGTEIPAIGLRPRISPQRAGPESVLWDAWALGLWPPQAILWGMQPASIERARGLSPLVSAGLDALVARAAGQLRAWGAEPARMHWSVPAASLAIPA